MGSGIATKIVTAAEAIKLIHDGQSVAIGGSELKNHPMALVREIVRSGRRGLHLLGWKNGPDFDMLVAAGCATEIESTHLGLSGFGAARNLERAALSGHVKVVIHSEETVIARFEAGGKGLNFALLKPSRNSCQAAGFREQGIPISCPFSNEQYVALRAWNPDVAIIHAHMADKAGNILLIPDHPAERAVDVLIAKSARRVLASVEQVVSREFVRANPHLVVLPGDIVDAVVEAPFGAHPCSCTSRYDFDGNHFNAYKEMSESPDKFARYLDEYVYQCKDEFEYLERIGISVLFDLEVARTLVY